MKAVILAAGEGLRLRPLTRAIPKPMIPIGNKPILEYVIEAVAEKSIEQIVMVVGYRKESILSHFGDGTAYGVKIQYVEQTKLSGTAAALAKAQEHLDGPFLVLNGDDLFSAASIGEMMDLDGDGVLITQSDSPARYGVVGRSGDLLVSLVEKPKEELGNLISTGVYRLSPEVFDSIEAGALNGITGLSEIVGTSIQNGAEVRWKQTDDWGDVVHPWDILSSTEKVLTSISPSTSGRVESDVHLHGAVQIGDDTTVRGGSYIRGPCLLGENCNIGPHAVIYPSSSIGRDVTIGPFTHIRRSVIMDGVTIGVGCDIQDSVIGPGVQLGPHTVISSAVSMVRSELGSYHEVQLGAVVGDDTHIDGNCIIGPGVVIGNECTISARKVDRNIASGTRVVC